MMVTLGNFLFTFLFVQTCTAALLEVFSDAKCQNHDSYIDFPKYSIYDCTTITLPSRTSNSSVRLAGDHRGCDVTVYTNVYSSSYSSYEICTYGSDDYEALSTSECYTLDPERSFLSSSNSTTSHATFTWDLSSCPTNTTGTSSSSSYDDDDFDKAWDEYSRRTDAAYKRRLGLIIGFGMLGVITTVLGCVLTARKKRKERARQAVEAAAGGESGHVVLVSEAPKSEGAAVAPPVYTAENGVQGTSEVQGMNAPAPAHVKWDGAGRDGDGVVR